MPCVGTNQVLFEAQSPWNKASFTSRKKRWTLYEKGGLAEPAAPSSEQPQAAPTMMATNNPDAVTMASKMALGRGKVGMLAIIWSTFYSTLVPVPDSWKMRLEYCPGDVP